MNKVFAYLITGVILLGLMAGGYVASDRIFGDNSKVKSTIIAGAPQIGGAFSLVNNKGENVTEKDFQGKLMLVFFGYTNCPDVCPTEMSVFANVMQELGDEGKDVTPVFITVDPDRDTVEVVDEFVQAFDASIVGLTGTPEQINAVKKGYRIYGHAVDKEKDPEFYLVDHTSFTYLMDRQGKLYTAFSYGTSAEKIIKAIKEIL